MRNLIVIFSILAIAGAVTGCTSSRRTTTTTHESVQTEPVEPAIIEKRTTTETETRTTD